MAEPLALPVMAPGPSAYGTDMTLACWARKDCFVAATGSDIPPEWRAWVESPSPYATACGAEPTDDLGLCAHHRLAIFPPEARHAPRA